MRRRVSTVQVHGCLVVVIRRIHSAPLFRQQIEIAHDDGGAIIDDERRPRRTPAAGRHLAVAVGEHRRIRPAGNEALRRLLDKQLVLVLMRLVAERIPVGTMPELRCDAVDDIKRIAGRRNRSACEDLAR